MRSVPGAAGIVFLNIALLDENRERAFGSDKQLKLDIQGDVQLLSVIRMPVNGHIKAVVSAEGVAAAEIEI